MTFTCDISKEKVLIASLNPEYLKNITKLVEKKGYLVVNSIYANDVIDRVRVKENIKREIKTSR